VLACQTRLFGIAGSHLFWRGRSAWTDLEAVLHCVGSPTPDPQNLADRLAPESVAMLIDEGLQDLKRRSSATGPENARDLQNLVGTTQPLTLGLPGLRPLAFVGGHPITPAKLNLVTIDPFVQRLLRTPIIRAIDSTAAHTDGCSPCCSCSSGGNFMPSCS
jgi:hypothetical protein